MDEMKQTVIAPFERNASVSQIVKAQIDNIKSNLGAASLKTTCDVVAAEAAFPKTRCLNMTCFVRFSSAPKVNVFWEK